MRSALDLRARRKALGISQRALAHTTGIPRCAISIFEGGKIKNPNYRELKPGAWESIRAALKAEACRIAGTHLNEASAAFDLAEVAA